jgi:hypothetical protein
MPMDFTKLVMKARHLLREENNAQEFYEMNSFLREPGFTMRDFPSIS